jgi:hypothetical protein
LKQHTSDFKEEIKKLGKQQAVRITYIVNNETIVLDNEDINSSTPNYEASLLKSVMKGLDLDSNIDIPLNTEIKFEYGLLVNGVYEYLDYGNYIVYSSEKQEDTLSYKIKCYDKMLYSMKDYEKLNITYPCTIETFLEELCKKIGLKLNTDITKSEISGTKLTAKFSVILGKQHPSNLSKQLLDDVFTGIGYTYRDVLDDIAEVTASTIYVINDTMYLGQIKATNDTINEEYINDTNVNFGEKYRTD